ncbi:hypothetical protein Unana1_03484 [Umbelopsis nana]
MTTRPISFPPQQKEPSSFAPSAVQNNTVGPFSAPEILPQYSPPVRQLSFGPTNSAGHLKAQANLPIQFSRRASLPPAPTFSILTQHLSATQPAKQPEPASQCTDDKWYPKPVNKIVSNVRSKQKRPYSPMGDAILEGQFLD